MTEQNHAYKVLQNEIADLETQIESLHKDREYYESEIAEHEETIEELERAVDRVEDSVRTYTGKIRDLKTALHTLAYPEGDVDVFAAVKRRAEERQEAQSALPKVFKWGVPLPIARLGGVSVPTHDPKLIEALLAGYTAEDFEEPVTVEEEPEAHSQAAAEELLDCRCGCGVWEDDEEEEYTAEEAEQDLAQWAQEVFQIKYTDWQRKMLDYYLSPPVAVPFKVTNV